MLKLMALGGIGSVLFGLASTVSPELGPFGLLGSAGIFAWLAWMWVQSEREGRKGEATERAAAEKYSRDIVKQTMSALSDVGTSLASLATEIRELRSEIRGLVSSWRDCDGRRDGGNGEQS
jgi:HAMP domain-containing protein